MKKIFFFLCILFWGLIQAQTTVSEVELKQFAKAVLEIQSINAQAQAEMAKIIRDEGYTLEEFAPLYEAKMSNDAIALAKISDAELKKINLILLRFDAIEGYYDKQAEEAIVKVISLERFDAIAEMLPSNPVLSQKLEALLRGTE